MWSRPQCSALAMLLAACATPPPSPEVVSQLARRYDSHVGARWLAIRRVAGDRSYDAQRAFMRRLYADGWAKSIYDRADLILPRADFDDSGG